MGAGLLHHGVGKPAHVEHDLGVLERPVVASLTGEEALDADLARLGFIRPLLTVPRDESLAVVLMHAGIHALLGVGCGGNQVDPEAWIHGVATFGLTGVG